MTQLARKAQKNAGSDSPPSCVSRNAAPDFLSLPQGGVLLAFNQIDQLAVHANFWWRRRNSTGKFGVDARKLATCLEKCAFVL